MPGAKDRARVVFLSHAVSSLASIILPSAALGHGGDTTEAAVKQTPARPP